VAPELEAVCARALRVEPGERYPDGAALAADLEAVLRGEAPTGARATPGRRRAGLALLAGLPLALVAVGLLRRGGDPAPVAAASAAPSPSRSGSGRVAPADPVAQLQPLLDAGLPPRGRARGLAEWLLAHGGHRRAGEARQALAAARGEAPLLALPGEGARGTGGRALFLGPDLLTWQGGLLRLLQGGGRERRRWSPGGVRAGLALPDGALVLAAYQGAVVVFEPPGDGPLVERLRIDCPGRIECLAADPARGALAVGAGDEVRLFGLADGAPRARFSCQGRPVHALALSPPEGRLVVAAGEVDPAPVLRAWTLDAGGECRDAWSHPGPVEGGSALAFSPDGRLLALGTRSHQLLLLDPASGEVLATLRGHPQEGADPLAQVALVAHDTPVQAVAFSPDGARLYSLGSRTTVPPGELRVWDVAARAQRGPTVPLPDAAPGDLVVAPDGERLLIGCEDGAVLVWAAPE
jgi:hypothetical protein